MWKEFDFIWVIGETDLKWTVDVLRLEFRTKKLSIWLFSRDNTDKFVATEEGIVKVPLRELSRAHLLKEDIANLIRD